MYLKIKKLINAAKSMTAKSALNTAINLTKKPSLFEGNESYREPSSDFSLEQDMSEDIRVLYRGIAMLEKIEKALILMWLEDRSYREISETMGISEKNVSVKLVRIKTKLSGIIEKLV